MPRILRPILSRVVWAVLAALAVLLGGCTQVDAGPGSNAIIVGGDDDGYHGSALGDQAYVVPNLQLTADDGKAFSLAETPEAPLTLVFFGYTHCPDICQIQMATLASALKRLDAEERAQVEVAFVTTDPARDTGVVLRDYLDQFDPEFMGLTGDLDTITAIGEKLGVYVSRGVKLPGGGYEVDHSTPIVAVNDHGRAPLVWTQDTSASQIADDIVRLLGDPAATGDQAAGAS